MKRRNVGSDGGLSAVPCTRFLVHRWCRRRPLRCQIGGRRRQRGRRSRRRGRHRVGRRRIRRLREGSAGPPRQRQTKRCRCPGQTNRTNLPQMATLACKRKFAKPVRAAVLALHSVAHSARASISRVLASTRAGGLADAGNRGTLRCHFESATSASHLLAKPVLSQLS